MRDALQGSDLELVMRIEPIALSPRDAAQFLGVSKRTLTRLIATKKIEARKAGPRTLVTMASLKAYFETLPAITRPAPLLCSANPKVRPKAKRKARH
ncbi:MAG: helix-turn-helix domain-containing protein [Xanthobacteraceae bacterium]